MLLQEFGQRSTVQGMLSVANDGDCLFVEDVASPLRMLTGEGYPAVANSLSQACTCQGDARGEVDYQ